MNDQIDAKLYGSAIRYLSAREHSVKELRDKLARKFRGNISSAQLDNLLDALRQQGLQSDQRFAESVVRGRIRKGYGPFFIERELGAKGVTSSVVHETEAWQAADWSSLVAEYLERKFPEVGAATENNASDRRQKAARSLQQRGFAATDIRRALFG
ncbi:MAG: regulatory protein RecX [Pseudomonadota bacterium]|nr:regulatory protein RecX [Pseudomonadota bacterium]